MTAAQELPAVGAPGPGDARAGRPAVAIIGNPNVGKTTLFNRLTGQNARVGNYPGITVERRVGTVELVGESGSTPRIDLVDVPGTYSLSARSGEEQIAINAILGLGGNPEPRLVIVVVDAGQLIRNLYLVLQLIELRVPLVIALNMIDEVEDNPPLPDAITAVLGVPCVATSAPSGRGVPELRQAVRRALADPPRGHVSLAYPPALRRDMDRVAEALPAAWRSSVERDRALALWALTSLDDDDELDGIDPGLRRACRAVQGAAPERDVDHEIIATRYAFLDAHAERFHRKPAEVPEGRRSAERVDRILIHPLFGFAFFLALMMVIFQSLFTWADPVIGLVEDGVAALQELAAASLPENLLRDLITRGLLGGVGNVVVFLPQILLLFLFIGILEDSGYMARVAYLMDRIMRAVGLHGRAFIPMMSGFACAIPAILATRTMERRRDRLLTMMVIPLMTCSARLPVYTLIIAALFPPTVAFGGLPIQGLLMVFMYLFSTVIALVSAAVLGRTAIRGRRIPLILELPPYRVPRVGPTLRMMWERSRTFLREAGTVILAFTVALWVLLSFPQVPEAELAGLDGAAAAQHQIASSYGGRLGKALEPALEPLGFDWKIGVGIIGAFAAREVFISTMGMVYGLGEVDEEAAPLRDRMRAETRADGRPAYTPLAGLSLMVFFALACQCMGTLAVVFRETRSVRWPAFMFAYMTALAWAASFLVYQGGRLLGI